MQMATPRKEKNGRFWSKIDESGNSHDKGGETLPRFLGKKKSGVFRSPDFAVWTGLEPATPCVTGRYSNQLNYHTSVPFWDCKYS